MWWVICGGWVLDSKHEASEQLAGTKLIQHDTLNMYFRVYKHILYSVKKNLFTFLLLCFSKYWSYISTIDWKNLYFKSYLFVISLYFSYLNTSSYLDNVIQESDHSYSTSVLLQDMLTYNDNSCSVNYTIINSLIKK